MEPGSSPQAKVSRADKGNAGGKVDGDTVEGGKAADGSDNAIVPFTIREFHVQCDYRLVEKRR